MLTFFTVCAVFGAVIMIAQLGMTLFGLDADASDIGEIGDDLDMGDDYVDGHVDSTGFFGILSFRSLMAALAFFGLVGRATTAAELALWIVLISSIGAGLFALVIVGYLMKLLYSLKSDGTVRIENCVGKPGKVYLSIPGRGQGEGKVTIKVQDREMEYSAVTDADDIPTGALIVVVGITSDNALEVQPDVNLNAIDLKL